VISWDVAELENCQAYKIKIYTVNQKGTEIAEDATMSWNPCAPTLIFCI